MHQSPRPDRRLSIQSRAEVDDGYGNPVSGDWTERFQTMAQVRPRGAGTETVMAQRLTGRVVYDVIVPETSRTRTITGAFRAVDVRNGKTFNIRHEPVDPDGERRWLAFTAETGGTDV